MNTFKALVLIRQMKYRISIKDVNIEALTGGSTVDITI